MDRHPFDTPACCNDLASTRYDRGSVERVLDKYSIPEKKRTDLWRRLDGIDPEALYLRWVTQQRGAAYQKKIARIAQAIDLIATELRDSSSILVRGCEIGGIDQVNLGKLLVDLTSGFDEAQFINKFLREVHLVKQAGKVPNYGLTMLVSILRQLWEDATGKRAHANWDGINDSRETEFVRFVREFIIESKNSQWEVWLVGLPMAINRNVARE